MKTLDPEDWAYRGNYDNSNDGDDPSIAHGANYHQGPEWVWPIGYFLRAYFIFKSKSINNEEIKVEISKILSHHAQEIHESKWKGIPELTNQNGSFCKDSNPIQAWSMACLLEVIYEMK